MQWLAFNTVFGRKCNGPFTLLYKYKQKKSSHLALSRLPQCWQTSTSSQMLNEEQPDPIPLMWLAKKGVLGLSSYSSSMQRSILSVSVAAMKVWDATFFLIPWSCRSSSPLFKIKLSVSRLLSGLSYRWIWGYKVLNISIMENVLKCS